MLTVYYMPYSLLVTEYIYMTRHVVPMTENISPRHPGYFRILTKRNEEEHSCVLQLVRHRCLEYTVHMYRTRAHFTSATLVHCSTR